MQGTGNGAASPGEYRLIDLFCGAGGMTLGFTNAAGSSFRPIWANDVNSFAAATYNANFGNHCIAGDIVSILENNADAIPQADIVIGGPPCQGFSLLNKNRLSDARKQLWRPFLDVVQLSGARAFVMENVPQILGAQECDGIVETAEALGFRVAVSKLAAVDYGVPQLRTRAFIVGSRVSDPGGVFPPKKRCYSPRNRSARNLFDFCESPESWRTVRDAISDLPAPVGTEIRDDAPPLDIHFGRSPTELSKRRYRAIPQEGMNRFDLQRLAPELTPKCWIRKKKGGTDLFGRLWWDRPSFTIRTEFFKPEKGRYLHPSQHRPITHREAARFQSFPDDFRFQGTKIEIARQIGNAVPPKLAKSVAESLISVI